MWKNGERVIDFFVVFFPLVKSKERQTNCLPLMISHAWNHGGAPGINSFMGAASGGHKRFETIKKFTIRKFEWYLYNIDVYVCTL